jgi:thioredoxin 1
MNEQIARIETANFETEVVKSPLPVLVDCWAAWCRPCLAMNPILDSVAAQGAKVLKVAKLNVEADKALAKRLSVAALPLFIIFKDGKEVSRRTGSMPASKLREWLVESGVSDVQVEEPPAEEKEISPWSAFYGDGELQDFFFDRFKRLAEDGAVRPFRFATWSGEDGNPSGALVHSDRPQVFENLTGMPYSFACAMDLAAFVSPRDIEQLHGALRPGANLELAAPALVREWLLDPGVDWPADLKDDPVGPVKDRWLDLAARLLQGQPPSPSEWTKLREDLAAAKSDSDPYRGNADSVANMLIKLSPPPRGVDASGTWASALMLNGKSIQARLGWRRAGWTREDIAQEALFMRWVRAREAAAPGGIVPENEAIKFGEIWIKEHQPPGFAEKKKKYHENEEQYTEPMLEALRAHLIRIVGATPK